MIAAAGMVLPFLVALGLAEAILRFLPVASGLWTLPVHAEAPLLRFTPSRDFVYSKGWNFASVARGRVNDAGFVNDQDYDPSQTSPLLAVIGDSYVEAAIVEHRETLQGRLQAVTEGGRIYSFGASGAALSQYLVYAEHARRVYAADALVFVVVGNDFDESLTTYAAAPGFHRFAPSGDSAWCAPTTPRAARSASRAAPRWRGTSS